MKLNTYKQFINEGSALKGVQSFINAVHDKGDVSDIWNGVENGITYVVIETEGMNKKAEDKLKSDVNTIASKHGYQYVKDGKAAQKLGLDNVYADDALLVYVGK